MIIAPILLNGVNRMLPSNAILTAIGTLLILHVGRNGVQFVNSATLPTPYPDPNARVPTITSKLENLSELHRTSQTPATNNNYNNSGSSGGGGSGDNLSATTTEGYLNLNANDSYGNVSKLNHFFSVWWWGDAEKADFSDDLFLPSFFLMMMMMMMRNSFFKWYLKIIMSSFRISFNWYKDFMLWQQTAFMVR